MIVVQNQVLSGNIELYDKCGDPIQIEACILTEARVEKALLTKCFVDNCEMVNSDALPPIGEIIAKWPHIESSQLKDCRLVNCVVSDSYVRTVEQADFQWKEGPKKPSV